MSRLTRDGTAEPVSRDQILRREERGQGSIHFPCSADHQQDWQPYPVDPCSCYIMCDYIHTYKILLAELNECYVCISLRPYFSTYYASTIINSSKGGGMLQRHHMRTIDKRRRLMSPSAQKMKMSGCAQFWVDDEWQAPSYPARAEPFAVW